MGGKTAFITGIAGRLAQVVAGELHRQGYELVGVDYRPTEAKFEFPIAIHQANYNKTRIEQLFRRYLPTHVLHLGRVGNLKERMHKRFDLNVIGSRKVMELSNQYGVTRLVVLSTFHIYGAHPHNHIPIEETDPLRAGAAFPQIADAIQLDNQALMWVYRHPTLSTVLLRPCHVVGPRINNAMSTFLRQKTVPVLMGFDPMVQFVHEADLAAAIVVATERPVAGVFNVAGKGTIPLKAALTIAGPRQVPVPAALVHSYLKLAGIFTRSFPAYMVNFFKYPCIITDASFRSAFDWQPKLSQEEALRSAVSDQPAATRC